MGSASRVGWVNLAVMIISGTLNTVFSKMQYDVRSRGTELCVDPTDASRMTTECLFDKPWFSSLLARIGMALPLVCLQLRSRLQSISSRRNSLNEYSPLLPVSGLKIDQAIDSKLPARTFVVIAGLAVLDQLQTLISNVGLLWVSSSVYQMARGSVIIFGALISVQFLKTRLYAFHVVSLAIVAVAVVLVSWSGMPHEKDETVAEFRNNASLGLCLIVLAQFIMAIQIAAEEHMMIELHVDPVVLVGVEGLWGLVFYLFLIPILTFTPDSGSSAISKVWHEDFYDSFIKLSNSNAHIVLSLLNIIAVAALGPSCNYVTKHLSTVVRSIAEVLRTLGVWLAGLLVFYAFDWRGADTPGESWTPYSWIELLGFVLMVTGTLAYRRIIPIPVRGLYPSTLE